MSKKIHKEKEKQTEKKKEKKRERKQERGVLAQPLYSPPGNERQFPEWNPSNRPLDGEENLGSRQR